MARATARGWYAQYYRPCDDEGQRALTSESASAAAINSFKPIWNNSNSGAIGSNFQGQKGLDSLQAEANITQQFGQLATKKVAEFSEKQGDIRAHEQNLLEQEYDKKLLSTAKDPKLQAQIRQRLNERGALINSNQANYER